MKCLTDGRCDSFLCNCPVYCLLFIVYCLLFIVYCLLFIVYCLLFIVYCLLFIVYCLLFIVYLREQNSVNCDVSKIVETFEFIEPL